MLFEVDVDDCVVCGKIFEMFNGGFYCNGLNWKCYYKQGCNGFYVMDGMIQGLIFKEGKVFFKNCWVCIFKFLVEEKVGEVIFEYEDGWIDWCGYGFGEVVCDNWIIGLL